MRTQLLLTGISWVLFSSCSSDQGSPSGSSGGTNNSPGTGGVVSGSTTTGGAPISSDNANTGGNAVTSVSSGGAANTGVSTSIGGNGAASSKTSDSVPSNGGNAATGGYSSGSFAASGKTSGGTANNSVGKGGSSNTSVTSPSGAGRSNTGGKSGVAGKANAGGSIAAGGNTSASSGGTSSTAAVGCTREGLQAAVDAYLAAQKAGSTSELPLAASVKYTENFKTTTSGIWQTALSVAFQRSLLDVTACQTFSEVFVTEGSHQYVLGIRLAIQDGQISEIESIVTDSVVGNDGKVVTDDWNFDAKAYLECSKSEDWSIVPADKQSTREALIAAGEAYFKIFSDKATQVPWGTPCYRLEGGKSCTPAMDKASQSCNVGIPDNINFTKTHWVVDVELNAAVGFTLFGGGSPDTHLFRLVDGKIRYVHTLTQGTG